jgi:hypothetical protein
MSEQHELEESEELEHEDGEVLPAAFAAAFALVLRHLTKILGLCIVEDRFVDRGVETKAQFALEYRSRDVSTP